MTRKKLCIAIPASIVSNTPHLREKTSKIGFIGRAAAIFRVGEIIIYPDGPRINRVENTNLVATLLAYMGTPQYLRKRLFKIKPQLRYAGILPPLRTPNHPLKRRKKCLKIGEYREGVTLSKIKGGVLIDIGIEQTALMPNKQLDLGKPVTVKITKIDDQIEVEEANCDEISCYWGYTVTIAKHPLGKLVKKRCFGLTIATSKYGVPLEDVVEEIAEKWEKTDNILIEFGAPREGLCEIVKNEGINLNDIANFVVNTIPMQGTETVRTEEALIASLAILNMQFGGW